MLKPCALVQISIQYNSDKRIQVDLFLTSVSMAQEIPLFCSYYQALVRKEEHWVLTASLRSFEHLVFDRTLNKELGMFEFFVPQELEATFLEVMDYFQQRGLVTELQKLPNRLIQEQQS